MKNFFSAFVEINEDIFKEYNETRNKEICDRMNKIIENGNKIVIWERSILQKDINDLTMLA